MKSRARSWMRWWEIVPLVVAIVTNFASVDSRTAHENMSRAHVRTLTTTTSGNLPTKPVDVFLKGEAGYFCIKIPDLLVTNNGTLLALGEARYDSCSDYTGTDLVFKRSFDGGQSWTELEVLFSNTSLATNETNVVGNAAPVQVSATGRILVPFNRNNEESWITFSDDDGKTWSVPKPIENVQHDDWAWVGFGPPSSIELDSGRILTPGYHGWFHDTDGDLTTSHCMYSDDGGDTWNLGGSVPLDFFTSECQAVSLGNDTILLMMRTTGIWRVSSLSYDAGESWTDAVHITSLVQPAGGCEGSTIRHTNPAFGDLLFFSLPNSVNPRRHNLTLFTSTDSGSTWEPELLIDDGLSGYSALAVMPDNESIGVLFERATESNFIFVPTAISFSVVWDADSFTQR